MNINARMHVEQQRFNTIYQSILQDGTLIYAGQLLQRAAHKNPEKIALIYKDVAITYRELYARACALSQIIKKYIKPRDRVLMCFENSYEFYIAYFAVWQLGAVVAPLNTFLHERELDHIIRDAKPVLIITASDRVDTFKKTGASLPPIITEQDMALDKPVPTVTHENHVTLQPDEMAALLYTSGTTGVPKGVMLSSRNIMTNLAQGVARFNMSTHERVFGVLPLFHVFAQNACVWSSIFMGATVIVVPKIDRRYILEGLQHKPTMFLGVPALYGLLCLLKTAPLEQVKFFICGGDALPDKIRAAFALVYRRNICNGYGLTETSPLVAIDLDDEVGPTNTVGLPCMGIQIAIRDEQEKDVPHGIIGQIWVRGDNVMLGYYNVPDVTAAVLKNGWFNTEDLGYIDGNGKLVIAGRLKDTIKHKGFNIYPQEIENVILSHPNVIRVGVVGQKDHTVGEIPIAFVQIRTDEPGMENALRTLCKQHLAAYKIPRDFICSTKELQTTTTGKVDKKVLRKLLQHEQ